jgi:hypothetical protein
MPRIQKKRLNLLADLLDKNAANEKGIIFNLSNWGNVWDPKRRISCNTEACAMGIAVLSGKFNNIGLGCKVQNYTI